VTKSRRYYISIEVNFFDHPKTIKAGERLAMRHLKAVAWCHKHQTDGLIPLDVGGTIVNSAGAAKLVAVGLWDEHKDGWAIHDYLEHQESRATLEAAAERGRIGAKARHGNG